MAGIVYPDESYRIVGACFAVYNDKGFGFLEAVYQECLEIEFEMEGIPSISQPEQRLEYRGRELEQRYKPDFVCYGKILVELKAVAKLADEHRAQVLNYLQATGLQPGILGQLRFAPETRIRKTRPDEAIIRFAIHGTMPNQKSPPKDLRRFA